MNLDVLLVEFRIDLPDNSVLSTQVSDLQVVKKATGAAKDATKRGYVQRFFDWVNIL